MSSASRRARSTALVLVAMGAAPHVAPAQAPAAYLRALTIPPTTVGTCLPPVTPRGVAPATARPSGRRLVMKTRDPGGERDIVLYVDSRGRPTGLSDRTHAMQGTSRSMGDVVIAAFDSTGAVRGRRLRHELTLPPDVVARRDPALLRARMQDAATQQATQPLDAAAQREVRALAAWMRDRCPAGR
ncbi:MAG: hypothetical protein ACXW61_04745 [Gemmatirosa sp.]